MIPDAELLSLLSTVLTKLDVGEFIIKVFSQKMPVVKSLTAWTGQSLETS